MSPYAPAKRRRWRAPGRDRGYLVPPAGTDELAIASVSVAEYRVGIELADTPERAAERARALATITSVIDVLDYTAATAAHHGRLLAHVRRSATPRGAHDLIIAAHAAETGRTVASRDVEARFNDLPGVAAIDV
jgi:tRNA(fMet)-specific endonuclease VapC